MTYGDKVTYREFLRAGDEYDRKSFATQVNYNVGFNEVWDRLRLEVNKVFDYENGECTIQVWLTPAEARHLARALTEAANHLHDLQVNRTEGKDTQ